MSNPTSNFNWQMPTNIDLVSQLPADFEVFGQAVDTSLADLKGGTTGQILAKNTNADMDFVWIANDQGDITGVTAGTGISGGGTSGTVTITNDMATTITASGDIVVGTGSGTYDNLPIGTTNQVLTADTTVSPYKVKWATPAGGGKVLQVVSATTTTPTAITSTTLTDTTITATITPTLNTSKIMVLISASAYLSRSNSSTYAHGRLLRDATTIGDWAAGSFMGMESLTLNSPLFQLSEQQLSIVNLDSPATTSAITYKLQAKVDSATNSATIKFQDGNSPSTIILMEIGV
jgi:hypothetical protein